MLTELGWSITCTDIDGEMVALCGARLPAARCLVADPDATSLPFADRCLALVLCIEVQPVVQSEWFPGEVARVLRPGGELVGVTWNRWSARGLVSDMASRLRGRGPHPFYGQSYRACRRRFETAGLELIEERGLCWFPFSRASNSPLVPVAVAIEEWLQLPRLTSLSPWIVFAAPRSAASSRPT
jgi:SAM-dependent methyltransferase